MINRGQASEAHIFIPTFECNNEYCILDFQEEETMDDLRRKYPSLKDSYIRGSDFGFLNKKYKDLD